MPTPSSWQGTQDYHLERAVPEIVFDASDVKTEYCSNAFVDVSARTPEQQPYEEDQQEDVRDFTLELQQDDEKACHCPVRKASDSVVTSSNQLSIEHSMRELRWLWDPGASAFLVTPPVNGSSNDNTGNEHVGYHLEQSPQPISYSAMEHVGVMAPPSVAAQAAGLVSACCSKTNNKAGYETMHVLDMQPPIAVQDDHKVLSEMHVSEVFEKEKQESEDLDKCLHKASDNAFSEQLPKYFSKPIFSLEGPTTGAFSFTNEKKSDNKLLAVCFNNTSDNAFSEEAKDFTYLHGLAERFIKLTHKKSTQVVSILCVQEAEHKTVKALVWSPLPFFSDMQYHLPMSNTTSIWNPGILNQMNMILAKSALQNLLHSGQTKFMRSFLVGQPIDLKQFWARMLLQYHSWYSIQSDFLQVPYFLPFLLDCPYSERVRQLVCYSCIYCMSTATTVHTILVLSSGKIVQEERDAAAVYHIFRIQLPMNKTSHIWDHGIRSLMVKYIWLHVHMIQLVACTSIDINITKWTSTTSNVIRSSEYGYTMDGQWEFLHEEGVHESYNAKNLLPLQSYLQTWAMDIIFITFLPP